MILVNPGFHTWKFFSKNYVQFGHAPSKKAYQPCPVLKRSKNISLKEQKIISLPMEPTYHGPAQPVRHSSVPAMGYYSGWRLNVCSEVYGSGLLFLTCIKFYVWHWILRSYHQFQKCCTWPGNFTAYIILLIVSYWLYIFRWSYSWLLHKGSLV